MHSESAGLVGEKPKTHIKSAFLLSVLFFFPSPKIPFPVLLLEIPVMVVVRSLAVLHILMFIYFAPQPSIKSFAEPAAALPPVVLQFPLRGSSPDDDKTMTKYANCPYRI